MQRANDAELSKRKCVPPCPAHAHALRIKALPTRKAAAPAAPSAVRSQTASHMTHAVRWLQLQCTSCSIHQLSFRRSKARSAILRLQLRISFAQARHERVERARCGFEAAGEERTERAIDAGGI